MGIESAYLQWLESYVTQRPARPSSWEVGIGDDAAVVATDTATVCCMDTVVEGVHFEVKSADDWQRVGRKALAVNLSDMASMAARSRQAMLSLVVDRQEGLEQAKAITTGLLELAAEFGVELVGGDTCTSNGPVVVTVTLLGTLLGELPVLRSTAQPGDVIVVSGQFGGSLTGKHWNFTPRVRLVEQLVSQVKLTSMTDVSDGLARDLYAILDASQCGAEIVADWIPISPEALEREQDKRNQFPGVDFPSGLSAALNDGEDFELLMTMSPADWQLIEEQQETGYPLECRLTRIGHVSSGNGVSIVLADGRKTVLPPGGYDH